MRIENRDGEGECYQVNTKVKAIYSDKEKKLISLVVGNLPVINTDFYTICLQNYHLGNSKNYLNLSREELDESGKSKVVTTSAQQVLEEYLRNHPNSSREIEGRLVYK